MAALAEMDPELRDVQPRPIPLKCILCPKKPSFSDISHLLTHVSSKSHLHHKFNIEMRAKSESGAEDTLRRYTKWYDDNGIETLLAERLSSKEQKKTGRRGRPRANVPSVRPSTRQPIPVKADPDDVFTDTDHLPPVGVWNTAGPHRSLCHPNPNQDPRLDDPAYHTPLAKRIRSPYQLLDSPSDPFQIKYERSRSTTETSDSLVASEVTTAVTTENTDEDGHASKLKGVIWPGMDLFDSATPDQKRKRNQRKDGSVLENMKMTSQAVTPTECIWGTDGEYQRSRDIYASPSIDGSPLPKTTRKKRVRSPPESPTKAKKGRQPRGRKPGFDEAAGKRRRQPLADVTTTRQTRASTRAAGQLKNNFSVKTDATDDDLDDMIKREDEAPFPTRGIMRNALDVFEEEAPCSPGEQVSCSPENLGVDLGYPGRTESPIEENDFDLGPRTTLQPINPNLLLASPLPLSRQTPGLRFFNNSIDTSTLGYRQHSTSYSQHFLGGGHTMPPSISESLTFTPLYSQARMGFAQYQPYGSVLYDDGSKETHGGLQSHASRLDYGAFSLSQPSNPYANATQRHTTDFDI